MSGQEARIRSPKGALEELVPEGALAGGSAFRLYYLIGTGRATGRLVLQEPAGILWELWFRRGAPLQVRTTSPLLGLGRYLAAQGALGPDELARAQAVVQRDGGELIDVLGRMPGVEPMEIFRHLAGYGRALLVRALALEAGAFRWEDQAPAPPGAAPLGETWPLLCEAGRRISPDAARRLLGDRLERPVMRSGDGRMQLEELGVNAQEARIAASFDGVRSLAGLARASPEESDRIARLGYFLGALGFASFSGAEAAREPTRTASPSLDDQPAYEFTPGPASPIAQRRPIAAGRPGPARTAESTPGPFRTAEATPGPFRAGGMTPGPSRSAGMTPGPGQAARSPTPGPQAAPLPRPRTDAEVYEFLETLDRKNHLELLGSRRRRRRRRSSRPTSASRGSSTPTRQGRRTRRSGGRRSRSPRA
ncbi:Flagellar hook-length control protein FliK [Vulgatibacter incomptus]|uniref:Flagellar hook-length control protein FliK n=1 Tax=Vulgatibacter incomptus TaxID=1391653 RepID=A0A0K1P8A0_9BACT|nr:DUF4388 domain-containing protein [Vulgatibacter incomptus]AKU89753.1 Flagellar hook-length control protein FliK [Vulgatibacter incomptus]